MRTQTPKNAATVAALARLATQLGMTPPQLNRKLLDLAVREVDWNLSQNCAPFDCCSDGEPFDPTALMARLTPAEIEALENNGDYAQRVLLTIPKQSSNPNGRVSVDLLGDKKELEMMAAEAGTTATNLARILIRDGLAKLATGEFTISAPTFIPSNS